MPGDPQEVKATPINSTSIHVTWKPPLEKDRNGIIRGYHIHVQEVRDEVSFIIKTTLISLILSSSVLVQF